MAYRNLALALITTALLASCTKNQQQSACGTQACTKNFVSVGVFFTDKQGKPVALEKYSVFNVSAGKQIYPGLPSANLIMGYYIVASDNDIKDFSSEGDDIRVSAVDSTSAQTKTVNFKISGGCNCHVAKISGPETVAFD